MKKALLILLCFGFFAANAQFTPAKTTKKRYKKSRYYKPIVIQEDVNDSAYIYYMQGWNAYKAQDFGAARWYWERGANCTSNIPSKYSSAFRLALLNQGGEGIGVNYDVAYYYFNVAYANGQSVGNVDATKCIGGYFENGMVVGQDYKQAIEWYNKAKVQGNRFCNEDIARCKQKIKEGLK
jgi:TPR repeat protein